jgi:hypothetical protein
VNLRTKKDKDNDLWRDGVGAPIPARFQCTRCDDTDSEYCAEHTYWSTRNAEFQRFWREYWEGNRVVPEWAKDGAPPQSGDRVRVIPKPYEGEYARLSVDVHHIKLDSGSSRLVGRNAAEIQVIARAKPAVPEDPRDDVILTWPLGHEFYEELHHYTGGGYQYGETDARSWDELWEHATKNGCTVSVRSCERGPVIGG